MNFKNQKIIFLVILFIVILVVFPLIGHLFSFREGLSKDCGKMLDSCKSHDDCCHLKCSQNCIGPLCGPKEKIPKQCLPPIPGVRSTAPPSTISPLLALCLANAPNLSATCPPIQ
jgi:hypothetical protein